MATREPLTRCLISSIQMCIRDSLITDYEKSDTSEAAESWIRAKSGCPVFSQKIRHSKKAKDATFYRLTPLHYSIRSGAAQDYKAFAAEYVQKFGGPAAGERS